MTNEERIAAWFATDFQKAKGKDRALLLGALKNKPEDIRALILQLLPGAMDKIVEDSGSELIARTDNANRLADNIVAHLKTVFAKEL